jgi:outer membrane protein TolC
MSTRNFLLLIAWLLASLTLLSAQDVLELQTCRQWAKENSPLKKQASLLQTTRELKSAMIKTSSLPQLQVAGQASYQSDVFSLPFSLPTMEIPEIPKFQFNASLNVQQKIYDGGQAAHATEMAAWEEKINNQQTAVDLNKLDELINGLFFNVLLMDKQKEILQTQQNLLAERIKPLESGVSNGVLLEGDVDAFRIRVLQLKQEISQVNENRATLIGLLEEWTGKEELTGFSFQLPERAEIKPNYPLARAEHQLFALQTASLQTEAAATKLSLRPQAAAFGRLGLGSPNPFNFFETGISPFYMVGVSLQWKPVDWKNHERKAQVLDLQRQMIQIRQAQFDQKIVADINQEIGKARAQEGLLAQDDEIISLQEKIIRQADAQLNSGVITSSDYLEESNKITQMKLKQELHRLQSLQAQVRAETLAGN